MKPGYDQPLYVLPFDHRPPYATEVFGFESPSQAERSVAALAAKQVIYDAFQVALASGVSHARAGILADTLYAAPILRDAARKGFLTIMPVERSGHAEFDFEAGDGFPREIETYRPTFVKALVKFNPAGHAAANGRQLDRLKRLSDVCRQLDRRFMLELIVPAEPPQMEEAGGDAETFDRELRPELTATAMHEIQDAGIEPDVWKIEGFDRQADGLRVAEAARCGRREHVGLVVLGRGEDESRVRQWLETAAGIAGFIGFAVGRTTFAGPLIEWRAGRLSRENAVTEIARKYRSWVDVFESGADSKSGTH